jgi:CBS-domain-containing membrane protein
MERDPDAASVAIAEVMTADVVTTTPDRAVEEVARELRARGFGGLPVVDDAGILVGIVSEFDLISKRGRTVGEVMTREVVSVDEDAGAEEVTRLMGHHGIRRVPVVRDGRLVGIVARSDLLRLFTLVRWACETCGDYERGFARPERCLRCGGAAFRFEQEHRTAEGF